MLLKTLDFFNTRWVSDIVTQDETPKRGCMWRRRRSQQRARNSETSTSSPARVPQT